MSKVNNEPVLVLLTTHSNRVNRKIELEATNRQEPLRENSPETLQIHEAKERSTWTVDYDRDGRVDISSQSLRNKKEAYATDKPGGKRITPIGTQWRFIDPKNPDRYDHSYAIDRRAERKYCRNEGKNIFNGLFKCRKKVESGEEATATVTRLQKDHQKAISHATQVVAEFGQKIGEATNGNSEGNLSIAISYPTIGYVDFNKHGKVTQHEETQVTRAIISYTDSSGNTVTASLDRNVGTNPLSEISIYVTDPTNPEQTREIIVSVSRLGAQTEARLLTLINRAEQDEE